MSIRRKVLGDLVDTQLKTITGLKVFRGEVNEPLPLIQKGNGPDPSGRVAPYVVHYTGAGSHDVAGERDVADTHEDLLWTVHLIVAAGYDADCAHIIDRVDAALFRWTPPASAGIAFGQMRPPPGYDPGPIRINEQVRPTRFWLPLQYQLPVTT